MGAPIVPFDLEAVVQTVWSFNVGERVKLVRDLPSVRAHTEGIVRGVAANANGISYAIRFDKVMRIVAERDLRASAEAPR